MTEAQLAGLLDAFLDRTLPAAQWTHEAHLTVALMLARRLPEAALLPALREGISGYNIASGGVNTDQAGYHEAITAFYAATIGAYARLTQDLPLAEAGRRLLAGPLAERAIVQRAYSPERLKTVQARLQGAAPDISGFHPGPLAAEALAHDLGFTVRLAEASDAGEIGALMQAAIGELLTPFLPPDKVEASREVMGLDTQLIADRTYYVVEREGLIVGCGGWSRRATLFGGDHSPGRDAALLDPVHEPARVRAMYTRPGWTRRGIGRLVLATCEAAAGAEGFTACELASTLGGEPLYQACGYRVVERFEAATRGGLSIPLIRMRKILREPGSEFP